MFLFAKLFIIPFAVHLHFDLRRRRRCRSAKQKSLRQVNLLSEFSEQKIPPSEHKRKMQIEGSGRGKVETEFLNSFFAR